VTAVTDTLAIIEGLLVMVCGGGLEYFYGALLVVRGGKSGTQSQTRQKDMVLSSAGFGPKSDRACKAQ
jgi:hypothetical protein